MTMIVAVESQSDKPTGHSLDRWLDGIYHSMYLDTCYIFMSDGRSELPRKIWSVRLPHQFIGVARVDT